MGHAVVNQLGLYAKKHMPRREELENNRYVGHLARRAELWRFTRRSVPRGVAIGLLVGIFALIPGVQMIGAALMCVPFRGNIPVAAGMTFLSNPASTPFILAAALWVGNLLGFHADLGTFQRLSAEGASAGQWASWLLSDAAPALVLGLLVISSAAAIIGYALAVNIWRGVVRGERKRNLSRRATDSAPVETTSLHD